MIRDLLFICLALLKIVSTDDSFLPNNATSGNNQTILLNLLNSAEATLNILVSIEEDSYKNVCSSNCSCSFFSCSENPLPLNCYKGIPNSCGTCGIDVNINNSFIKLADNYGFSVNEDEKSVKEIICSGTKLDHTFADNYKKYNFSSQYLGAKNGVFRSFPGQEFCQFYDPRARQWYVGASTGAKDIIFILDDTKNIDSVRLQTLKKMTEFIKEVSTFNDYIGIVKLSDLSTEIMQATNDNKVIFSKKIDAMTPKGDSNFEKAFNNLYTLLENNKGKTSNCQQIIIGIFSEIPSAGITDPESFFKFLKDKDTAYSKDTNRLFFIYDLKNLGQFGNFAQYNFPGIYSKVDNFNEVTTFYNFFNILNSNTDFKGILWTEPYHDALGNGMVATVGSPVYDRSTSPPRFIGIAGVDITLQNLLQTSTNQQINDNLRSRSSKLCSKIDISHLKLSNNLADNANNNTVIVNIPPKCDKSVPDSSNLFCNKRSILIKEGSFCCKC